MWRITESHGEVTLAPFTAAALDDSFQASGEQLPNAELVEFQLCDHDGEPLHGGWLSDDEGKLNQIAALRGARALDPACATLRVRRNATWSYELD